MGFGEDPPQSATVAQSHRRRAAQGAIVNRRHVRLRCRGGGVRIDPGIELRPVSSLVCS